MMPFLVPLVRLSRRIVTHVRALQMGKMLFVR
jgi:hypothetical protein